MKGFTIFFAMLVASLALAIGLAIFDLTSRELTLSATVTQSQYATYAADTGAECALYWDFKCTNQTMSPECKCINFDSATGDCIQGTAFPETNASVVPTGGVLCNGKDIASDWDVSVMDDHSRTTKFTITFSPQPYCATVYVYKTLDGGVTKVDSYGYNTCANNGQLQLEREFLYGPY